MAIDRRRQQIRDLGDAIPVVAGGSEGGAHDVHGERVASDVGEVLTQDAGRPPDVAVGLADDLAVVTLPRRRRTCRLDSGVDRR